MPAGEVSLTGRILPIGGVKEKLLAARRSDVKTVLFPEDNRKDYDELKGALIVLDCVGLGALLSCCRYQRGQALLLLLKTHPRIFVRSQKLHGKLCMPCESPICCAVALLTAASCLQMMSRKGSRLSL